MNVQEQILGTALATGLKTAKADSNCPRLEEIACLVDGTLAPPDRDLLLGHLALCGRCRQTFISARELAGGESTEVAGGPGRRRYLFPSSLAAAAVLVVAVTLTLKHSPAPQVQVLAKAESPVAAVATVQPVSPKAATPATGGGALAPVQPAMVAKAEIPVCAETLARSLAQGGDLQQISAAAGAQAKSYGFAGEGGENCAAFRIGMTALDLEVALLADDSDRAQGAATRLGSLLQAATGDESSADIERLVEKLEKGEKARSLAGKNGGLTRLIPREKLPYLRLGAWSEAARIAAKTGDVSFLSQGVPAAIQQELSRHKVAPETSKALRALDLKLKNSKGQLSPLDPELDALMRTL